MSARGKCAGFLGSAFVCEPPSKRSTRYVFLTKQISKKKSPVLYRAQVCGSELTGRDHCLAQSKRALLEMVPPRCGPGEMTQATRSHPTLPHPAFRSRPAGCGLSKGSRDMNHSHMQDEKPLRSRSHPCPPAGMVCPGNALSRQCPPNAASSQRISVNYNPLP